MSYSRFGKDSDIHAFSDGENIIVDVARTRPDGSFDDDVAEDLSSDRAWHYLQEHVEPIGLPFDGERYSCPHATDAIDRLLTLRDAGYAVPEEAIDALKREASLPPRACLPPRA